MVMVVVAPGANWNVFGCIQKSCADADSEAAVSALAARNPNTERRIF